MTAKPKRKPRKVVVWAVVLVNARGHRVTLYAHPYAAEAREHLNATRRSTPNTHIVRCEGCLK
jgi:hypothetical protein